MHPNAAVITRFYTAFAALDHETMAGCYRPDVRFSDPAFPALEGWRAAAMWRMLCERAKDFELSFSEVTADDRSGSATWVAKYTFGATGRSVVNHISATFVFKDGLILQHTDVFDFHAWSSQALGLTGKLLGWTGLLQRKVQATAGAGLEEFIVKRGISGPE